MYVHVLVRFKKYKYTCGLLFAWLTIPRIDLLTNLWLFLYTNIVNEIYCHFTLVNDLQGNNDYFVFQQHLLFISVKSYIFSHFAETEYIFFCINHQYITG